MNIRKTLLLTALTTLFCLQTTSAAPKTYKVTGSIVQITDNTIVIQKGEEKLEIARDQAEKFTGVMKIGDLVTIHYRMSATKIDLKPSAADKKEKTK